MGVLFIVAGLSLTFAACQTTEPGVTSTQFQQSTHMEVGTAKGTQAAEAVLKDLGLKDITSSATNLDGWAKGMMSDKTIVKVGLERVGQAEDVSEVTVTVGSFGDPTLGKDIIRRMRNKLGIQPPSTQPATTQGSK
jgi:hypothetical protein